MSGEPILRVEFSSDFKHSYVFGEDVKDTYQIWRVIPPEGWFIVGDYFQSGNGDEPFGITYLVK